MLEIEGLRAGYSETMVIHDLALEARAGRVLALLGRNGAGKTTTLRAVMGMIRITAGSIRLGGQAIHGKPSYEIARRGVAYVPDTRDIFASLTVRENLVLATRCAPAGSAWTLERVLEFFPSLARRLSNGGNQLSGGEQQMLSIGRALLMGPQLLILDEPTEGLAPLIVRQIHDKLLELKREGMSMILVEQNFGFATSLADDVCIVSRGAAVWRGSSDEIGNDRQAQSQWLGV
jgi:branched-chain amino acid transport system ATP-binding protein